MDKSRVIKDREDYYDKLRQTFEKDYYDKLRQTFEDKLNGNPSPELKEMIEKIITMIERRNQESNILSTQPDDLNAKINKLKTEINITKALIDIDNQEKQVVPREKLG